MLPYKIKTKKLSSFKHVKSWADGCQKSDVFCINGKTIIILDTVGLNFMYSCDGPGSHGVGLEDISTLELNHEKDIIYEYCNYTFTFDDIAINTKDKAFTYNIYADMPNRRTPHFYPVFHHYGKLYGHRETCRINDTEYVEMDDAEYVEINTTNSITDKCSKECFLCYYLIEQSSKHAVVLAVLLR